MINDKNVLYSILEGMPMAVYLKDLTGKITYLNKFAKNFLGLSNSSRSTKKEFIKSNLKQIKETDEQVINEKCYVELEETIKLKDDDVRWFNIHKYPVYNDDDEISGICVIARDVELEKKAQEQRETYIATLTHDLQNPTLAQINALDLLLEERLGTLNDEQKNLLNLTKDSCTYMLEMLLSLLDTYKFENEDYIVDIAPCDLSKMILETCARYKHLLNDKNIKIITDLTKNIKNFISDEQLVKRVLNNLFRFIINYSFKNKEIKVFLKKESKNFVKVEIVSCGYHIPPKTLNGLFEKYTTHFSKYNTVGVDICLYHSKQIVSLLGGAVSIKSFENTNTIELILPIRLKREV